MTLNPLYSPRRPGSGRCCDSWPSCPHSAAPWCSPPWGWCGPWSSWAGSPPGPRTLWGQVTLCWPAQRVLAPEVGSNLDDWGFDPSTVTWKQDWGYAAWARPGSRCLHTCRCGLQSLQQSQTEEREGTEWENEKRRPANCDYSGGSERCARPRCHWPHWPQGVVHQEAAVEAHWGEAAGLHWPHCLSSPQSQIEQGDLGTRPRSRRGWRWGRAPGWGWGWWRDCARPDWRLSQADSCSLLLPATAWPLHSTPCNMEVRS